jgi:uncharacterized glyoxalase superfamily protein PhnB
VVEGAQCVIDFLKRAFNATERRRYDMPDGTIMHAEVQIDDTVVMIADGGGEWPPFPSWLHVYVSDVDATYRRALEAGGISVQEPKRREGDPDRRGGVKDPGGNTWWIGTQLIILLALGTGCAAPAGPPASAEADLRAAVRTYDSAWAARDTAVIGRVLAQAYTYFTSVGGLSDRAVSLGFLADTSYVLTMSRRSEVAITIAGTVGRVSSRWEGEGRFRGEAVLDDQTCGQIWLWERSRWLLFTEHCANRVPAVADSAVAGPTGAQS